MKKRFLHVLSALITFFILQGCSSLPPEITVEEEPVFIPEKEITLLFSGDVMAHKYNYSMKDYSLIWDDIRSISLSADFSFMNLESPVAESYPYSSYPKFNMHEEYPLAAIEAGFNVISLVNNHTNDKGLQGIEETLAWSYSVEEKTSGSERPVFFSGLKDSDDSDFSYSVIQKDDWKILFVAVTEILNRHDYKSRMNYVPFTQSGRQFFVEYVNNLRKENPCDLFIVSIHSHEEEYSASVSEKRKEYYNQILESGADVIWANHPHIIRATEFIGDSYRNSLRKVIMYGNGNTISGQRHNPDLSMKNPLSSYESRGDGLLMKITFVKKIDDDGSEFIAVKDAEPYYITVYIDDDRNFLIKTLDDDFIDELRNEGRYSWADYIQKRIEICKELHKQVEIWR